MRTDSYQLNISGLAWNDGPYKAYISPIGRDDQDFVFFHPANFEKISDTRKYERKEPRCLPANRYLAVGGLDGQQDQVVYHRQVRVHGLQYLN
jgi:hypothetical protein